MIRLLAFAKINLTLSIAGRRSDGYHDIDSLVQTVDLADRISVGVTDEGIRIENDLDKLEGRDLAEVAAERILRAKDSSCGLAITIEKGIPVGAGLGGGSSDAAAVLAAVDRLVPPTLSGQELTRLASEIGSDVPLFLRGGRLRITGRGERVSSAGRPSSDCFVLIVPPIRCETREVYERWSGTASRSGQEGHLGRNELLEAALSAYPELAQYHVKIGRLGAAYAGMSGSGSSFYAAFPDSADAEIAAARLRDEFAEARVFVCTATREGHRIIGGGR
ncbi:MAG: 4-(cytidine 5'-diphospho)-2-C-methyl-D-erythritol kinase [Candidatus Bipolaricaulia bacterium]